jgi:hypothetical protein
MFTRNDILCKNACANLFWMLRLIGRKDHSLLKKKAKGRLAYGKHAPFSHCLPKLI